MVDNKTYSGLPPAVLLPARNYVYKEESGIVSIVLPKKGKFIDIDPTFNDNFKSNGERYNLVRKTQDENEVLYLPDISRVLFAKKYYPALDDHQVFILIGVEIKKDSVVLHGKIVSILTEEGKDPDATTTVQ